jgi:hypothetical protein
MTSESRLFPEPRECLLSALDHQTYWRCALASINPAFLDDKALSHACVAHGVVIRVTGACPPFHIYDLTFVGKHIISNVIRPTQGKYLDPGCLVVHEQAISIFRHVKADFCSWIRRAP